MSIYKKFKANTRSRHYQTIIQYIAPTLTLKISVKRFTNSSRSRSWDWWWCWLNIHNSSFRYNSRKIIKSKSDLSVSDHSNVLLCNWSMCLLSSTPFLNFTCRILDLNPNHSNSSFYPFRISSIIHSIHRIFFTELSELTTSISWASFCFFTSDSTFPWRFGCNKFNQHAGHLVVVDSGVTL